MDAPLPQSMEEGRFCLWTCAQDKEGTMLGAISQTVAAWSPLSVFLRLLLATVTGIVIGAERERHNKDAGMKTHVLVCLGSALCMVVSQYMQESGMGSLDMARIGASVVSGVGFLGVGTIIVTGTHEVRGLTTAAGLWASACIGLAAGAGYLDGALMALAFVLFTYVILRRIDAHMHLADNEFDLYVELESNRSVKHLLHFLRAMGANYSSLRLKKSAADGDGPIVTMHVKLVPTDDNSRQGVVDAVGDLDYVYYAEDF